MYQPRNKSYNPEEATKLINKAIDLAEKNGYEIKYDGASFAGVEKIPPQPPKQDIDLTKEAQKYKSAEEFVKAQRTNKLYHVSDNPNLKLSKDYQPKQGQLGKGLYVTKDPEIWQGGQIGKRPYVYEIDASNLKIANDYPASSELIDWGSKNGYYKKDFLKKPNGEYVLGIDGKPMKIWQETSKAEKLMDYKDPMTGSKMSGLEQEYLKSKGYDGVSASYSPDGEQSLIFNYDKVKINPVKTKSQLTDIWNKANKTNADDALIQEARKYKSADEFVKAQGKPLYHGTSADFEPSDFKGGYLTGDKNYAEVYKNPSASSISYGEAGIKNKESGQPRVLEYFVDKDANIFDYTNPKHRNLLNDYFGDWSMSGNPVVVKVGN